MHFGGHMFFWINFWSEILLQTNWTFSSRYVIWSVHVFEPECDFSTCESVMKQLCFKQQPAGGSVCTIKTGPLTTGPVFPELPSALHFVPFMHLYLSDHLLFIPVIYIHYLLIIMYCVSVEELNEKFSPVQLYTGPGSSVRPGQTYDAHSLPVPVSAHSVQGRKGNTNLAALQGLQW